jgi:hypothetical protein
MPIRPGIELWEFAERTHPVYERPPAATRWPVPLEGTRAAGYVPWMVSERVPTREPLMLTVLGHPSVTIHRQGTDGPTVQTVRLRTSNMQYLQPGDLEPLRRVAAEWYRTMVSLSRGPYNRKMLEEMGHPYGYPGAGRPTWGRLGKPRGYGRLFKVGWAMRGVKGFVPPLSVINLDTGNLAEAWYWETEMLPDGVEVRFGNAMPYAFYLAHGTVKMRAHGPWQEVAERLLPALQSAWREGVMAAARRRRALAGAFGEEAATEDVGPGS